MNKLFKPEMDVKICFSTEEFLEYHKTASVISTEAATDFLYAIKDKVNTLIVSNIQKHDTAFKDAMSDRFLLLKVLKRTHFSDLARENVSIPERFQGNYADYLKTMIQITGEVIPETIQLLNNLKMAVSGFINEYSENGIMSVYGKTYVEASDKLITKQKKVVSQYFPTNKSNTVSKVKDVVSGVGEIEYLFNTTNKLEGNINHDRLKEIVKISKEVSEMVDVLIEQNSKSGILIKNDAAKRDLVEMIHVGATSVEFVAYLYANSVYFYNALKSLSDKVLEVDKR